ncbi:hypothetical protein XELAEV_18008927mg [Xenopus laevis]|uniref:Uncharacterized protein n=1 Tax=Xenopus laevis TaxID=8355 RepID=A0A974DSK0_XENLA|nr:hypothetical protein XELAEV_18008927mg [Xenopus laevis]
MSLVKTPQKKICNQDLIFNSHSKCYYSLCIHQQSSMLGNVVQYQLKPTSSLYQILTTACLVKCDPTNSLAI